MSQRVTFTREAVYRVSWDVEIPDKLPRERWEGYLEDVLDVYNTDEDRSEFYEYAEGKWFDR